MTSGEEAVDGRRARRERGRVAVVDAVVDLIAEHGGDIPTAQAVSARAGVSVSSIFRYFESLDALRADTITRVLERYAPLYEVPAIGTGSLEQRISRLVRARAELYATIAPIARLVRAKAMDVTDLAESLAAVRRSFAQQVRRQFAPELAGLPKAAGDDLVAAIGVLTSFESWDLLVEQGRTPQQIRRAWSSALRRLTAA